MEITPFNKFESVPGISLIGKLCTLNDYQQLRNYLNNITLKSYYMIIDLSRLTFTSSHGLGIFLGISRKLKATGKELILYNPRDEIKAVLILAGIDKSIKAVYKEEDLKQTINSDNK